MTDYKQLCAKLHAAFNTYAVDMAHHDLLERARAALAEPAPEGPTPQPADGEVADCLADSLKAFLLTQDLVDYPASHWSRRAADLLERLSTPQPS